MGWPGQCCNAFLGRLHPHGLLHKPVARQTHLFTECVLLRRFTRDLPPGLTTFNDACLAQQRAQPRQPAMAANREHVRAIVAEAQRPAPGLLAYAGESLSI